MQCQYFYDAYAQCPLNAGKNKRHMCPSHNLISQRKEDKRKYDAKRPKTIAEGRPSRAKPKQEKPPRKDNRPVYYDHTAPWHCSLQDCDICKGKPTQSSYLKAKYGK